MARRGIDWGRRAAVQHALDSHIPVSYLIKSFNAWKAGRLLGRGVAAARERACNLIALSRGAQPAAVFRRLTSDDDSTM